MLGNTGDTNLDLPVYLRREIVRDLLETKLRATSVGDALVRQQHMIDQNTICHEINDAVLLDLEALTAAEAQARPEATKPRPKRGRRSAAAQDDLFGWATD